MCKNWNFTGETKNIFAIEARALIFLCGYIIQVLLMRINGLLCNLKYIAIFMRNLTKTKKWCTCQVFSHASAHVRFLHKTKKEQFHNKYLLSVMYTLTEVVLWWFWTNNGINLHCIDYFCYMSGFTRHAIHMSGFDRNQSPQRIITIT